MVFSLGTGVRNLMTNGLSTAAEQFLIGSTQTLNRFSFFFERVEGLMDRPEDMGFALLGEPDERVFDSIYDRPVDVVDPYAGLDRPNQPTNPNDPKGGTTATGAPLPAGCDRLEGGAEEVLELARELLADGGDLTPELTHELGCVFAQIDVVPEKRLPRLIGALSGRTREEARPFLKWVLLQHAFAYRHRLLEVHIEDLLETYDADALVNQMDQAGIPSIRNMVSAHLLAKPAATTPPTAEPTAEPTKVAPIPVEEKHPASWFDTVHAENVQFEACMSTLSKLQRDFLRYKRTASRAVEKLDLSEMKENGVIREVPYCPGGGSYRLIGIDVVGCRKHGTKAVPWKRRREYEVFFKRWELGREALDRGRPEEALFNVGPLLAKQPTHGWLLEVHGEAHFELERFKEAAQSFYTITQDVWPADAYHLYHAGMAFYASGNTSLASHSFKVLLKDTSYETSRRRYPTRFDYYRVREKAQWMLDEFLHPRGPDGRAKAAVRYLEFKVAPEPEWEVERCRRIVGQIRDDLYEYILTYYSSPVLRRLAEELREEEAALGRLEPFEAEDREKIEGRILEIERKIAEHRRNEGYGSTGNLVRDLAKEVRDQGLAAHPEANYRVNAAMELHCTLHPHLLDDAAIAQRLRLEPHELELLNTSLSYGILTAAPDKKACYERQEQIWSKLSLNPPAGYVPSRVAALLGYDANADAECPNPIPPENGYRIRKPEGVAMLDCRTHGSRELFLDPLRGVPKKEGNR